MTSKCLRKGEVRLTGWQEDGDRKGWRDNVLGGNFEDESTKEEKTVEGLGHSVSG